MSNDELEKKPAGRSPALLIRLPVMILGGLWRFFRRNALVIVGLGAIAFLLYFTLSEDGLIKNRQLRQEKERLESEIERLNDENRLLGERLERLKNDPGYVEDEARKKLGLIRPDETVYRLSEEPDLSAAPFPPPSGKPAGPPSEAGQP